MFFSLNVSICHSYFSVMLFSLNVSICHSYFPVMFFFFECELVEQVLVLRVDIGRGTWQRR